MAQDWVWVLPAVAQAAGELTEAELADWFRIHLRR